jgi:septal ring factor EnvC (AmiA/AmiB activator)
MNARAHAVAAVLALTASGGLVRADKDLHLRSEPSRSPASAGAPQSDERSLRTELGRLSARRDEMQRRIVSRGRMLYRLARVGILPVGGGLGALFEHAAKVERTRRALEQDLAESRATDDRKVAILHKLDELAAQKAKLELLDEGLIRASGPLEDVDPLRSAQRGPRSGSETLALSVTDRQGRASSEPAGEDTAEGFRAMKGRLPLPISSRVEIRRVRRPGASGPGIEVVAPSAIAVRAVFAGRVAFADRYDPFGSVIILDHGDHFYTMMGDLGSVDVRVGDEVSAGARIGAVGPSNVLYFEIRRGSTTLDPAPWLGI